MCAPTSAGHMATSSRSICSGGTSPPSVLLYVHWDDGSVVMEWQAVHEPHKRERVASGEDEMAMQTQRTGMDVVGDVGAWGSHFCLFYETKEDLLDGLISYYKSGLERGDYCLWIVAEPLTIEEATAALKDAVPDLDRYLADSSLEFTSARDWFFPGDTFDGKRVTDRYGEKLAGASARGYPGMRVSGDTTGLLKKDWGHWCDVEDGLNGVIGNQHLAGLCSYPLPRCGAPEILDVVRTYQFALARRHGSWEVVETAGLKQAKAEIIRLNEELEKRVEERTRELARASETWRGREPAQHPATSP